MNNECKEDTTLLIQQTDDNNQDEEPHIYNTVYDYSVNFITLVDWICGGLILYELYQLHFIYYYYLFIFIIILARFGSAWAPINIFYRCKNQYMALVLLFLSPFFAFFRSTNYVATQLLNLKPLTRYSKLDRTRYSPLQLWAEDRFKYHIIHSIPHCMMQSFPQLILLMILLLQKRLTFKDSPIIWISFFSSLLCIILCSPIYVQKFFYGFGYSDNCNLYGSDPIILDHYDKSVFIFVIFSFILDFMCLIYVISYFVLFSPSTFCFPTTSTDTLVYVLWYYQFLVVSVIIIIFIIIGIILCCLVFHQSELTNPSQINTPSVLIILSGFCPSIGTLSTICASFAGILCIILVFIMFSLLLHIISFIWFIWLAYTMYWRWEFSHNLFYMDMMDWVKHYKDRDDLIIRILCINYHLFQDIEPKEQIIKLINKHLHHNNRITFKDIRECSLLKSSTLYEIINNYIESMTNDNWSNMSKLSVKMSVIIFGIPYFSARMILVSLPIIGFIQHYADFNETFIVLLSFVYSVIFCCGIIVSIYVVWNLWIWIHIAAGFYWFKRKGNEHFRRMQKNNRLYAVKASYFNLINNANYQKQKKMEILQSYFLNEIVEIVLRYLPVDSVDIDYAEASQIVKQY